MKTNSSFDMFIIERSLSLVQTEEETKRASVVFIDPIEREREEKRITHHVRQE